jgi:fructokinase
MHQNQRQAKMEWFGGIEAGGTKFNCMIAQGPDKIIAETTIPTRLPSETLTEVVRFFTETEKRLNISVSSIGVATFGPINLSPDEPNFGVITSTPKIKWQNTPILEILRSGFKVPVYIDTDVNAAAEAEGTWGAGMGLSDFIYLTVGTGIGGGVISNCRPIHGISHPEVGHMRIMHDKVLDPFEGICPFHHDCLEGLASGPAIKARWSQLPVDLPKEHPAWQLEAAYLAQAIHNLVLVCSPQKLILGGGVMQKAGLFEKIRNAVQASLNHYLNTPLINESIENYIVPPFLGNRSGMLGAIAIAQRFYK